MKKLIITILILTMSGSAYAAESKKNKSAKSEPAQLIQSTAPTPDELSKKAQQEAMQKSSYMNSKYKQHDKKTNPDQTAIQTQAKHGGPTASNVTPASQNSSYIAPKTQISSKKSTNSNKKNSK